MHVTYGRGLSLRNVHASPSYSRIFIIGKREGNYVEVGLLEKKLVSVRITINDIARSLTTMEVL